MTGNASAFGSLSTYTTLPTGPGLESSLTTGSGNVVVFLGVGSYYLDGRANNRLISLT